jgi:MYXO-CTERM domain-containing protein
MRRVLLLAALALLAAPAAAAHAAGGGLSAAYGGQGATNPHGQLSYVAVPAGRYSVIQALRGGSVERFRRLRGHLGVPQVTYDGAKTGLSADGSTLVLSDVVRAFPVKRTHLLVLDAHTFRTQQRITLRGSYSVDAVSPGGDAVYLVHYLDQASVSYEVVAYDRRDRTRKVIMDPDEPDEKMSGTPMSRVTSADGRWEFTLYDDADEPFIHALDTQGETAECIDLPQLTGRDLSATKLTLDGGTIAIGDLARLDPETQAVTLSGPRPVPLRATPAATREDGVSPWPIVAVGLAALGLVALVAARRRRSAHEVVDLQVTVDHPDQEPVVRR